MTEHEVILEIRNMQRFNYTLADDEVFNMAIKALEKQIPYKPQEYEDKYYGCKCGEVLLEKWEVYQTKMMPKSWGLPYCLACGQKLDWE